MTDEPTAEPWYPIPEDEPPQDIIWIGPRPDDDDEGEGDGDA